MRPERGSEAYEEQVGEVVTVLRASNSKTDAEEDQVIVLFALDRSYSREAIMDGLGRYRSERRRAGPA